MGQNLLPVYTKEFITPLGQMLGAALDDRLIFLMFAESLALGYDLKKAVSLAGGAFVPSMGRTPKNGVLERLAVELDEYFAGRRRSFSIPVLLSGTGFQKKAWEALTAIPFGRTWSYSRQARYMGAPGAVRAAGRANGRNRISIVVPCHRVINKNGKLGGYSAGLWRKEYLLKLEGAL